MTNVITLSLWCVYASEDHRYAQELQRHLHPLEQNQELRPVSQGSEADLVLLLVSSHLPIHLRPLWGQVQKAQGRGAIVIQIKVRAVESVPDPRLQVLPRYGACVHRDSEAERDEQWVEIVRELRGLLRDHPRRQPPAAWGAPLPEPLTDRRKELCVRLQRDGDRVQVDYPGSGQPAVTVIPPRDLRPAAVRDGELRRLLFPSEATWQPVLRERFGLASGDTPVLSRYPVRLRVWTSDPELALLPWHRLTSDGQALCRAPVHWTCEVSPAGPGREHTLSLPGSVLVFAPHRADEALGRGVESVLRAALPRGTLLRCQLVTDPALLAPALEARPSLVYVIAEGECAWIIELLREARPQLVYLQLRGAPPTLGLALAAAIPLCAQSRGGEDPELFLSWLELLLRTRSEPVAALHLAALPDPPRGEEALAAAALPLCFSNGTLRVYAPETRALDKLTPLRLDRDTPRAQVRRNIEGLINSRRVEALVVHAEGGNHLERFIEQAMDEVHDQVPAQTRLLLHDAAPGDRQRRAEAPERKEGWEDRLLLCMPSDGDASLASVLRRAQLTDGSLGPTVLWIDCGVHHTFKKAHLAAWLSFCQELAAPAICPDGLRVVVYLALVRSPEEQRRLEGQLKVFRSSLSSERLRISFLHPLSLVDESDLNDYLYNRRHSNLPVDLVPPTSALIIQVTGGHYEQTVAILEKAQRLGWDKVTRDLKAQAALLRAPDDEE